MAAVVYDFSPSRAGEHARNFLQDWKGKLICDDFGGYKASFEQRGGRTHWQQLRREPDPAWAPGPKNWLFAGSLRGGKRAAAIMSLIKMARLNGHDPYAYLTDVLTPLPTQRASEIDQLHPHKWQPVITQGVMPGRTPIFSRSSSAAFVLMNGLLSFCDEFPVYQNKHA